LLLLGLDIPELAVYVKAPMRPIRSRRGYVLIAGTKTVVSADDSPPVQAVCPRCQQMSQIVGKRYRRWFTLFFLPVFPVSGARAFSECSRCAAQFEVDAQHLGAQVAAAEQQQSQQAITLYNSLGNSPANSITLE
jgi:hypothetical protein